MSKFLCLFLMLGALLSTVNAQTKISVDLESSFRTTALLNVGMDYYQTTKILNNPDDYREHNKLFRDLYDKGGNTLFTVGFAAINFLEYRLLESIKDKTLRTIAWGIYAYIKYDLVRTNERNSDNLGGMPLIWIQFKFN